MKKIMAVLLGTFMMSAFCFGGCGGPSSSSSSSENDVDSSSGLPDSSSDDTSDSSDDSSSGGPLPGDIITDRESIEFAYGGIYKDNELADAKNGFSGASDITGARFMVNGEYKSSYREFNSRQDVKLELYNGDKVRMVNVSAGMAYTLPASDALEVDYSIAKYRTQIALGDSILTMSAESSNPYTSNADPWGIYRDEWLLEHFDSDEYIAKNNLTRTAPVVYNDLTVKEGFDVYMYSVRIEDENNVVERPYYNVAVIRESDDVVNFALFVMKSKTDRTDDMKAIVDSYSRFNSRGVSRNYYKGGTPIANPKWNSETLEYYNSLTSSDKVNWGVFSWSMPGLESQLDEKNSYYKTILNNSQKMQNAIETAWDYQYDIYPTYTHIGYGDGDSNRHHFPSKMAETLAGGNGKNGKPVLQFTYQFTLNNNDTGSNSTPMFDILRGRHDEAFRRLAKDIKAYGKPVLFRLNNEMNTDWTSYCGMITLLDPDIFVMTWQRLYDIFEEEGVDNCIWIWNPIADSCPYSSWGEDLCYNPGTEYFQLLGATSYEMNNGTTLTSFKERYTKLYNKNKDTFPEFSVIISEFACGSGGDTSGALGRNAASQAKWVEDMFKEFNAAEKADYVKQIKGAVWFNCNDSAADGKIINRLRFMDPDSDAYDDLGATIEAFKKGLNP